MRESETPALQGAIGELWELARASGLDPLPTHFEVVPASILYEVAAYGLPGRFSHWSHGKAYQTLKSQYDLGLVKYFELVINSRPAQAFLLDTNDLFTNKFVVAHVLGHSDFFAHNAHFRGTDRDIADRVTLHADRLRAYENEHGREEVESFLEAVLTIEEHVDPWAGGLGTDEAQAPPISIRRRAEEGDAKRVSSAATMVAAQSRSASKNRFASLFPAAVPPPPRSKAGRPREEETDLLLFLLRNAPDLEDWQRDAIAIVREEALYFRPQMRTKVMNEGWATLWHTRLLREFGLTDGEYTDFARLNASVRTPHPGGVNPYLLGVATYEEIIERLGEEEGLRQCMLIREVEDDVAFLRNHFTREVAERLDMFVYARRDEGSVPVWKITAKDFETVRETLIRERENGGRPVVVAVEGESGRDLVLRHRHDGRDLEMGDAQKTLERVARVWGRRVRLQTLVEGQQKDLVADAPR